MFNEYDRPITYRERLLLALICALCAVVMATCMSCAVPHPATRTPSEQMWTAVAVFATCQDDKTYMGTGTVLPGGRVLTALHVIACEDHGGKAKVIWLQPDGKADYPLMREMEFPVADLAVLSTKADISKWYVPVHVGRLPKIGDTLCEAAIEPRWTYRCGIVQQSSVNRIVISMFTEFGNSGAAVYDSSGRLVGVTDWTRHCQGNFQCEDGIVPIQSLAWVIEE